MRAIASQTPTVYLAGPDVFLPDAREFGVTKKRLCAASGFVGVFPLDKEISEGPNLDLRIFEANMRSIKDADCGIFNLTPFRGVSADVGTVLELGVFVAMGKPVFGYTNDATDLIDRIENLAEGTGDHRPRRSTDRFGMSVEDFGNADNLMITAALARQGRRVHRVAAAENERFTDLRGFVACLEEARTVFMAVDGHSRSSHAPTEQPGIGAA